MTRTFDAIFEHGLLKPLEAVDLPEGQPLRVHVEASEKTKPDQRRTAFRHFCESVERGSFYMTGRLPSRDELHER